MTSVVDDTELWTIQLETEEKPSLTPILIALGIMGVIALALSLYPGMGK